MTAARRTLSASAAALAVGALVATPLALPPPGGHVDQSVADGCPPGFRLVDGAELVAEQVLRTSGDESATRSRDEMLRPLCLNDQHPEPFAEIAGMQAERTMRAAAPFATVPPGAYRAALAQRDALAPRRGAVPGASGRWAPYGRGPLIANDERYGAVNGLGLAELNGRIDSFDYDEEHGRLFALIGTGGVWMSEDLGESWRSIGETLPTQINGAVAHTPAGGPDGTLVVVSGEHLMGGNTYTGLGAFWSNDLGRTWHQSRGVPDGALGFQVEVDPTDPREVYVATSMGLFRSTDVGKRFTNVALPTSEECAGATGFGPCEFANFVTDVVIKEPGGVGDDGPPPGTVLAAVGFRSQSEFPDGTPFAPGNGLYRSDTGEPGTFERLDVSRDDVLLPGGFAPEDRIGRTELGVAVGPEQDHDYVYAIVEDAVLFDGGVPVIDAPEGQQTAIGIPNFTVLNGVYVSDDFGGTWTMMADDNEIARDPTTGSSLTLLQAVFAPGIQAWYNLYIKPDPTRQDADGVPTRLIFGLEEVFSNKCAVAQNTAQQACAEKGADPTVSDFEVIGTYFAGETCLFLLEGVPQCPTQNPPSTDLTTHPDQHDGIWIPREDGGVAFVAGTDGGAYVQQVGPDEGFDNTKWGAGNNDGFNTLLPYHARIAKDGVVWFGLQDNGSGKIVPQEGSKQFMTFGGDGFFVAVDPDDSDYAWSEVTFASMRVTTDGGESWRDADPGVTNAKFSNPFVMDPTDADHLMTAGRQVVETVFGPDTQSRITGLPDAAQHPQAWKQVFDLGTNPENGRANSMSAVALHGDAAYVGFCGVCDINNNWEDGFFNGIATNVGGDEPPERMTSKGWHVAAAEGLPNRYITAIEIDPEDPETVYVTLGGYSNRQWVPPGSYLDPNEDIGEGHVFRSTDAGETFVDISGDLPDVSTNWVELREDTGQLVIGTDVGVFLSSDTDGARWAPLDRGLPNVPVTSVQVSPGDPGLLVASTFGRGVYAYRFPAAPGEGRPGGERLAAPADLPTTGGGVAVAAVALLGGGALARRASRRRRWG